MASTTRIIAIDGGNIYTGVVIADLKGGVIDFVYMDVFQTKDKKVKEIYGRYLDEHVEPFINKNTLVVYENVFFRNYRLVAINKSIRSYFENLGIKVRVMQPFQKSGVKSKTDTERKLQAVVAACNVIPADWIERFNSFERKHDVADAILMINYLKNNPAVIEKKLGKKV